MGCEDSNPIYKCGKVCFSSIPTLPDFVASICNLIISERIVRFRLTERYLRICHHDLNKCGWLHQWGALMGTGESKDHADGGGRLFILFQSGHLLAEVILLRLVCWWWVVWVCGVGGLNC